MRQTNKRRGQRTTAQLFNAGPAFASEAAFQAAVVDVALKAGWLVQHTRPAMRQSGKWSTPIMGSKGFPDLVMVKGDTVLYRELKMPRGTVSAEQRQWIAALSDAGCDVAIWYPRQYDETIIPTLLRGIRY